MWLAVYGEQYFVAIYIARNTHANRELSAARAYIYTFMHIHFYTCTHVYIYTYIHIYIYTYIHTYVCNMYILIWLSTFPVHALCVCVDSMNSEYTTPEAGPAPQMQLLFEPPGQPCTAKRMGSTGNSNIFGCFYQLDVLFVGALQNQRPTILGLCWGT